MTNLRSVLTRQLRPQRLRPPLAVKRDFGPKGHYFGKHYVGYHAAFQLQKVREKSEPKKQPRLPEKISILPLVKPPQELKELSKSFKV
jgi:hypothetical protein